MKKDKFTVSIGIPVYNEKEGIENLLDSIIRQDANNFNLDSIFVLCDGTNDGTDTIVEKLAKKDSNIRLINDRKRKGKIERLKEIFRLNVSDIILVLDGDMVLGRPDVITEIVNYFKKNEAAIVSANNQPVESETFTGKMFNYWSYIWYLARLRFNDGDNVHNIRGCSMAISREFARKINFPPKVNSYARYMYFFCQQQRREFYFAKNALVLYRKPDNLQEYIVQISRASPDKDKLEEIFGSWIKEKYKVPVKYKLLALFDSFFHNPLLFVSSALFNFVTSKYTYKDVRSKNSTIWETAPSTKKRITVPF